MHNTSDSISGFARVWHLAGDIVAALHSEHFTQMLTITCLQNASDSMGVFARVLRLPFKG